MIEFILQKRMIFWNIVLLVFVKILLPQTSFQLANILGQIPQFDSREIISLTNDVRSKNGLGLLIPNSQLDLAASEKLNDMAKNNYFAHISPEGVTPWYWINKANYDYFVAGENLAIGFFSANDTLGAWINSSSHKANLLNPSYKDIGVAVGKGRFDGAEGIMVVQMFGFQKVETQTLAKSNLKPLPGSSPVNTATSMSSIPPNLPTISSNPPSSILPAEVKLQYDIAEIPKSQPLSTDNEMQSLAEPVKIYVSNENENNILRPIKIANLIFTIYSSVFALATFLLLFRFEKKRLLALQVVGHTAILVLALTVPSANQVLETFIF